MDRPLIRSRTVAALNSKTGDLLIECRSYGGDSGAPVFVAFNESLQALEQNGDAYLSSNWKLVGVQSGFLPGFYQNKAQNGLDFDNSGLCVIVPISYAVELMCSFK